MFMDDGVFLNEDWELNGRLNCSGSILKSRDGGSGAMEIIHGQCAHINLHGGGQKKSPGLMTGKSTGCLPLRCQGERETGRKDRRFEKEGCRNCGIMVN